MTYTRLRLRAWANRNWWWLSCGYGTTIILMIWAMIASSPEPIPDPGAMMLTAALSAAALTGVMIKCKPGYGKAMTFRQARFNAGNDR